MVKKSEKVSSNYYTKVALIALIGIVVFTTALAGSLTGFSIFTNNDNQLTGQQINQIAPGCTTNAQCPPTQYCGASSNYGGARCFPKRTNGLSCTTSNQCSSNVCSNGRCASPTTTSPVSATTPTTTPPLSTPPMLGSPLSTTKLFCRNFAFTTGFRSTVQNYCNQRLPGSSCLFASEQKRITVGSTQFSATTGLLNCIEQYTLSDPEASYTAVCCSSTEPALVPSLPTPASPSLSCFTDRACETTTGLGPTYFCAKPAAATTDTPGTCTIRPIPTISGSSTAIQVLSRTAVLRQNYNIGACTINQVASSQVQVCLAQISQDRQSVTLNVGSPAAIQLRLNKPFIHTQGIQFTLESVNSQGTIAQLAFQLPPIRNLGLSEACTVNEQCSSGLCYERQCM
ncbi:MAG: dickkopf-related protein [Candidatus Nanoarchaeia archaeon]